MMENHSKIKQSRRFQVEETPCSSSEVSKFREQQTLQEQAARQGLNGFAMVARHQNITARMEQGAEPILQLMQEGKKEEVIALLSTTEWC